MSTYEIIPYRPEFREEVIALRRYSFETEFRESREYLEWKYEQNPYLAEPIFYLARTDGRVIGMRGFHGTRWEFGAARESVILPCGDDFVVTSAHRNSGVMTLIVQAALADLARRGFEYAINTSAGRITALSSLASGWKSAGAMEPMVRRTRRELVRNGVRRRVRNVRGAWRFVRRTGTVVVPSAAPFRRFDAMGRAATRDRGTFIVSGREPRPEAMAALIARLPHDGRIRHLRDQAFFAWRYRNPIREYRYLYAETNGRLEGYLVVARYLEYQPPVLPFHIVDWEGINDSVRAELLRCAMRTGDFSDLGTWAGMMSPSGRVLLARAGFVPTETETRARGLPCVLLKKLGTPVPPDQWMLGGASALDASRWDMRMVYSMHG